MLVDAHLKGKTFFVAEKLTLADIVLYAYTHVADEGGFDLGRWPNVETWCERIKGMKGYIGIDQ